MSPAMVLLVHWPSNAKSKSSRCSLGWSSGHCDGLERGPCEVLEEPEMNLHQSNPSVLRVVRGEGGFWEVRAARLRAPLFHFRTKQDAKNYAEDIAHAQPGISVEIHADDEPIRSLNVTLSR